jgi:uncharacterized Zn-binding protein involved in type VI secretion
LNGVLAAQAGPYTVVVSNAAGSVTSAVAQLTLDTLGDAVEAPEWSWRGAGDASWIAQTTVTHDGVDAARSGVITHGQNTRLETYVMGPGTVSFWWRVSSESGNDQLRFYVGSEEQARISGEVAWQSRTFSVPAGSQLLKWRYSKNDSGTSGQDQGWVDEIRFEPAGGASPARIAAGAGPQLHLALEPGGGVSLQWSALAGQVYQVQYASDLAPDSWSDLGGPLTAAGPTVIARDSTPLSQQRFYRVVLISRWPGYFP